MPIFIYLYIIRVHAILACLKGFDFTPETSFPYVIIVVVVITIHLARRVSVCYYH